MTTAVLAVDVGGTTIKGSVIDRTGRSHFPQALPTHGGPDCLAVVREVVEALATAAAASDLDVLGAGVVTPGVVDAATGRVGYAANLGWRDLDLRGELQAHLGMPVAVDHDVRAASDAEALIGPARGATNFVLVQIGTGIAAALVIDGHAVTGVGHAAGEVGHMPVYPRGERCGCGQLGCLEVYASGAGITRRYRALGGQTATDAGQVVAVRDSDPVAARVWAEAIDALAVGVTTITMTLDPALIVLGGGVARAGRAMIDPLRGALAEQLVWRRPPPIARSALGSASGRIGAAIAAFREVGHADVPAGWSAETVLATHRAVTVARRERP